MVKAPVHIETQQEKTNRINSGDVKTDQERKEREDRLEREFGNTNN